MLKIKAVLFDLGDILFEAHYWRKWLFTRFKKDCGYKGSFKVFYKNYESHLLSVYENKTTYSAAFIKFCKTHGMDNIDKFYQEAFEKKKYYEDTRELFAGVTETLAYLKKEEIKRVIVSDNELSSEALIEQVLNKYCIGDQFEYIFTSIDLRRTKAEREYFQLVLDNLDLGCNEVLFVGHDAEEIITANSVGIETIEFNNYLGIPAAPKQKIKKIADLIQVIKNYDSGN